MTVTMQSALNAVQESARRLLEATRELVLIAVEDAPRNHSLHLFQVVHDAVLELAGEAEQADAALWQDDRPARRAEHWPGPARVARCQAHVNALGAILVSRLAAPEKLADLAELRRDRGREVGAWAEETVRCVGACQLVVWTDLQPALLGYWAELIDITSRGSASGDGP